MTDPSEILYVSDLDGTLLTPDSYFPDDAADRLNRLIDNGLQFTIATARNYDSVQPVLSRLNLNLPVILFNGVYMTELHSGENLALTGSLCQNMVVDLMALAESLKLDPFVYTYTKRHQVFYRNITNRGSRSYVNYVNSLGAGNRLQYVTDYKFLEVENVTGVLFIDTYLALEPLYQELSKKHENKVNMYFAEDISQPEFYWLQIFHSRTNKGNMLEKLAKYLGIEMKNTVAFGDYLNDLEMFDVVGQAIAVANALPEVLSAADLIIGTNAELAVIDYLEKQFLLSNNSSFSSIKK